MQSIQSKPKVPRITKEALYISRNIWFYGGITQFWVLKFENHLYVHTSWDEAIRTFNKIRFERILESVNTRTKA